ncbi:MAG: acyl-CoA-binding protein [Candidatus Thermoplasmatota archaeon]|jgi:acyl-CoA-binding protein|nr:acyl-CoA-binding protein [Candidatus Thermoplasmatota archaeon]MEE3114385.1 acyl-CoA-binding protein [Candidatus Thermoplasmatota archaeon]|tara:strand:- start:1105 stop:1362 length:258 start_codon:yes stop_codon:yes gene_type:complete
MSLRRRFERAQKRVWRLSSPPSDEALLELYALFKQGSEGDCSGRPRGNLKERWKWKFWKRLEGTPKDDAMLRYCDMVDALMSAGG